MIVMNAKIGIRTRYRIRKTLVVGIGLMEIHFLVTTNALDDISEVRYNDNGDKNDDK